MAITTRAGKGSALTHTELDTNFSELDTRVDTLENETITKADITDFDEADYADATHTHVKADITDFDETDYADATHTHVSADITDFNNAVEGVFTSGANPKVITRDRTGTQYGDTIWQSTNYTDTGITVDQSVWQEYRITATDETAGWVGATGCIVSEVTDSDNWKAKYVIKSASQVAGAASNNHIVEVSQDEVKFDNTDKITIDTIAVYLPNIPTADPVSAGQLWNDAGTLKISAG